MARGKYVSLEEARKDAKLDQFCKEHPSVGNRSEEGHRRLRRAGGEGARGTRGPGGDEPQGEHHPDRAADGVAAGTKVQVKKGHDLVPVSLLR